MLNKGLVIGLVKIAGKTCQYFFKKMAQTLNFFNKSLTQPNFLYIKIAS